MGANFSDITLYCPTAYSVGTREYYEEKALQNYISDLYIICMRGYKPPNTTRVCIQPSFYNIWDKSWKNGSIISTAVYFDYDLYSRLKVQEKYRHILDTIHQTMLQLSEEYNWEKSVFEKSYEEVITNNFLFKIDYPIKMSRDRKKYANISLIKTETTSIINALIISEGKKLSIKLIEKKNWWWYDSAYQIVKSSKWFDNDKFGLTYKPLNWNVWYSLKDDAVIFETNGVQSDKMNIEKIFRF